eukprot:CAMPEP_0174854966 /NCGR_PEP_ID=MMETSP1114-20130205/32099_1 /TAXON_ID=312471 /ORGANISM="Neobodo designis, Strain CCAP 1951/1" /LENGTH=261 /DNA_ID=CAMNT_0016089675 /DNA_START=35 /DNA_END=820 /DNA_ORIENTATION=+
MSHEGRSASAGGSLERMSVQELRRERDSIRVDMERVVRQMQQLEAEIDAKRPGADQKREELGQLRGQLSDLRRRMRVVMDAASAQDAHHNSSAGYGASSTPRHNYSSTGASPAPGGNNRSYNGVTSTYGSATSSSVPRESTKPLPASSTSYTVGAQGTSQRAEAAMRQLQQRHEGEKEQFEAEIARLSDAMRRRHQHEVEALSDRLRNEAARVAEYEEARLRMERAQAELEALNAQPSVLDQDFGAGGPPELRSLRGGNHA